VKGGMQLGKEAGNEIVQSVKVLNVRQNVTGTEVLCFKITCVLYLTRGERKVHSLKGQVVSWPSFLQSVDKRGKDSFPLQLFENRFGGGVLISRLGWLGTGKKGAGVGGTFIV